MTMYKPRTITMTMTVEDAELVIKGLKELRNADRPKAEYIAARVRSKVDDAMALPQEKETDPWILRGR